MRREDERREIRKRKKKRIEKMVLIGEEWRPGRERRENEEKEKKMKSGER